ncbi:MAG: hypothetical protein FJ104_03705, partial [Deltaproteobacteria bacterium]|nr:hypothetical protein [Deltaproteobacteria bacterium]
MTRLIARTVLILVPSLAIGCVGGSGGSAPSAEQAEALKAYVLDQEPVDVGTRVNIDYDGKLMLLGSKVEPAGPVNGGQRVKVTMYWKVTKELGEPGWRLFTHVVDSSGERLLNIDNVGP